MNNCLNILITTLKKEINEENSQNLSNEHFIGYLNILIEITQNLPLMKKEFSEKYDLLTDILTKVLFKQSNVKSSTLKEDYINPDKYSDNKLNRNSNNEIRNACYKFILVMLRNSIENFEKFFSVNLIEKNTELEEEKKSNTDIDKSYYGNSGRNEDYVGIRNLGCICYMNAMMQQFFMVPTLRYSILQAIDNKAIQTNNSLNIDDNILHQVQRLFSFLDYSCRQDYNPQGFCYAFKVDVRIIVNI